MLGRLRAELLSPAASVQGSLERLRKCSAGRVESCTQHTPPMRGSPPQAAPPAEAQHAGNVSPCQRTTACSNARTAIVLRTAKVARITLYISAQNTPHPMECLIHRTKHEAFAPHTKYTNLPRKIPQETSVDHSTLCAIVTRKGGRRGQKCDIRKTKSISMEAP